MNKINSSYLLVVITVLFIFSTIVMYNGKSNMQGAVGEYNTQKKIVDQFSKTHKMWFNEKKLLDTLKQIISISGIKNVKQEMGQRFIVIHFQEKSLKKIEKFVNSILNNHIIIEELLITNDSVKIKVRDFS